MHYMVLIKPIKTKKERKTIIKGTYTLRQNGEKHMEVKKIKQSGQLGSKYELKVFCPFCSSEYTASMLHQLEFSEASYTTNCVGEKIYGYIDIVCDNCKRLVYRKEVSETREGRDWSKE